METFQLKCPICSGVRTYTNRDSFLFASHKQTKCRSCATFLYANKKSSLNILLEDTCKSYYWIGFLLADGHFSNKKRIKITLSIKDKDHLLKLQSYLKIENMAETTSTVTLSAMDGNVVSLLVKKFNIENNKTYKPPVINIDNRNLLISLIAGFIDGDGHIANQSMGRKDFKLAIKCHSSWLDNLKLFSETISDLDFTRITKQGYVSLIISNTVKLKQFKEELLLLDLPLMNRKWDFIDLTYKGKYELSKEKIETVRYYISLGYNQTKIKNILNVSSANISQIFKQIKNEQFKSNQSEQFKCKNLV